MKNGTKTNERAPRSVEPLDPMWLVFASSFALYTLTCAPGAFWLDSSELTAASHTLGIPHPPGHPLYLAMAHLASLIPLGSLSFRINLLSGLFGAICNVLCYQLGVLISERMCERHAAHRLNRWLIATFTLVLGASSAMWLQSVRAEVYTLNTALTLGATTLVLRWSCARADEQKGDPFSSPAPIWLALVLLSLGLANHHYLVALSGLPLLAIVLADSRRRSWLTPRALGASVAVVGSGLAVYAYLPIRGASQTPINWAVPTTWERFFDAVSAKVFQSSVTESTGPGLATNLVSEFFGMLTQLHPATLLVAVTGWLLLVLRERLLALWLTLVVMFSLLSTGLMRFDALNPDHWGYLQLALAVVVAIASACAAAVCAELSSQLRSPGKGRVLHGFAFASCLLLLSTQIRAHGDRCDLREYRAPEVVIDATYAAVPPGGLLMCSFFSAFFNHWHAQWVDGRRPDIAVVQQTFNYKLYDGRPYTEAIRTRLPYWRDVFDAFLETSTFPHSTLLHRAASDPIFVEPDEDNGPVPAASLLGRGFTFQIVPGNAGQPTEAGQGAGQRWWDNLYQRLEARGRIDEETTVLLVLTHFLNANAYLHQGALAQSRIELSYALRLKPQDNRLHQLRDALDARSQRLR